MMSYTSNSYGYQRPAYGQTQQAMMGSAGVYAGAPVVSFPAPQSSHHAPVIPQTKPFYRCWDNTQKKWFYWEKDSSVTSWTEPPAHVTLIDHETGSIVQRDAIPAPATRPVQAPVSQDANSTSVNAYAPQAGTRLAQGPSVASQPTSVQSSKPVQRTVQPNYSAGVSRYTQPGATSQSTISAAEKSRLEEADRLIAEQLQKQLSMEAEAELVAACPLPGEAAKMLANQKKKINFGKPSSTNKEVSGSKGDEDDIADMAKHGFVVKKQKPKANKGAAQK